jgi:hypothetical protein
LGEGVVEVAGAEVMEDGFEPLAGVGTALGVVDVEEPFALVGGEGVDLARRWAT